MKTFVVLAVSIVLVGILFCPMVRAAPSMQADLQMIQPDPSLPKELSAFFGKWEGSDNMFQFFLIVEKIDKEKASLYCWRSGAAGEPEGWKRFEAKVTKEREKYKISYSGHYGPCELTQKGKYLDYSYGPAWSARLKRVE